MRFFTGKTTILLLVVLAITFLVYLPGTHGDFEFDDSSNILTNGNLQIDSLNFSSLRQAAFSGYAGPLKRPISMVSFAINYYFGGFNPFYFKLTNVIIHLLAGIGIYVLITLLFEAVRKLYRPDWQASTPRWLAVAVAAAWLLHPLNLTGVLYIVQRMTSLSALFVFWALAAYMRGRLYMLDGNDKRGIAWILFGLIVLGALSVLSKENGALIPLFMFVTEISIFRFAAGTGGKKFLYGLFGFTVMFPAVAFIVFLAVDPHWLTKGYDGRDFTLGERLLTQARVLWFYLRLTYFPSVKAMGIFHDDFPLSTGWTAPGTTLPAVVGIIGLLTIGLLALRKAPVLAFGILWFFVGQSMESSIIPLEMVFEHRNYVPIVGPLVVLAYYLPHPALGVASVRLRTGVFAVFVMLLATVTWMRSEAWSSLFGHAVIEVRDHPFSERANYQMGRMYFMLYMKQPSTENYDSAERYLKRAADLSGADVSPLVGLIQLSYLANKPVPPGVVPDLGSRLRSLPPNIANTYPLQNLVTCNIKYYCRLPDKDVIATLGAMLENPRASSEQKGNAYTMLGSYYADKLNDLARAGKYFKLAVQVNGQELSRRIDLAHWYIRAGEYVEAQTELEKVKKLDLLGQFSGRIMVQQKYLAEERAKASRHGVDTPTQ